MKQHTKEPWEARLFNDPQWAIHIKGEDFTIIGVTSQGNDEANSKRIVACVNACTGIPNEFLERVDLSELLLNSYPEMRAAIAKATQ